MVQVEAEPVCWGEAGVYEWKDWKVAVMWLGLTLYQAFLPLYAAT